MGATQVRPLLGVDEALIYLIISARLVHERFKYHFQLQTEARRGAAVGCAAANYRILVQIHVYLSLSFQPGAARTKKTTERPTTNDDQQHTRYEINY